MENCSDDSRCSTTVEYIGYIYILPFICSLAVIFNVLVLLVFARSNFQSRIGSSTLTYLRGLAVADGMACLVSCRLDFSDALNRTALVKNISGTGMISLYSYPFLILLQYQVFGSQWPFHWRDVYLFLQINFEFAAKPCLKHGQQRLLWC